MFAPLLSAALVAAAPPTQAAHPDLAELDQKRFELHLEGTGAGRFVGGAPTGGGGLRLGLGVRLWRGLYLEASVGEGVYANAEPDPEWAGDRFRHAGHDEGQADAAAATVEGGADLDIEAEGAPILAGQILLGLRYELRTPKTSWIRPTAFLGASHLHEASLADFLDSPGSTLAGTGRHIRHRTGLAAGLGLRLPMPARWGPVAPRFSGRLGIEGAYYFDDAPGRLQAGVHFGVQVVF